MITAKCPWCDEEVELRDDVKNGSEITCSGCDAELVVSRKGKKVTLEEAEEEDWEDY